MSESIKPKRELSQAALCAKAIKKELKEHFPKTTFKVISSNFSGGNSVHIDWNDGPTNDQVREITCKYQYGNFNGMEDIYEYNNKNENIPQAKYVTPTRHISTEAEQKIMVELEAKWGFPILKNTWYSQFNSWGSDFIYQESRNMVL